MRMDDRLLAGVFILAALAIITVAAGFPRLAGMSVGPGLFPIVLSAVLIGASILLAVSSKSAGGKLLTLPHELSERRVWWRVLAVFGSCLLFALLGKTLGFVIVGILSLLWLLLAFGTPVRLAAIIAVVTVILINLFLVRVMRIPLPLGLLSSYGGIF
jgi:putative tricarboxylic transport membrane protein